jgi:hypothetical protein
MFRKIINKLTGLELYLKGFILHHDFVWKKVNQTAISSFNKREISLSKQEDDILYKLDSEGFAVLNLDFFEENMLERIQSFSSNLSSNDSDIKSFLKYKLGGDYGNSRQKFDSINPLLEIALNHKLINLIDSYFKMASKLCYLEINETILPDDESSKLDLEKSQKYHKDPGINKCVKVFIYLTDVDKHSGPFTYIKKSHKEFMEYFPQKYFGAGGLYPDSQLIDQIIDKDLITPIYGKAGTLIIADTTGLHCGGNSLSKIREMATMVYYPPGDIRKSKIDPNFNGLEEMFPASIHLLNTKI